MRKTFRGTPARQEQAKMWRDEQYYLKRNENHEEI